MRQILWFRRDLRVNDSAILSNAKDEVLPIFVFDKEILDKLNKDDKRVTFIYRSVLNLKDELKSLGLDLAIFYGNSEDIFSKLKTYGFDEVLCSCDFDDYSKKRDEKIEKIIPLKRYYDSFLIKPWQVLKKDQTAYRVFTPFYKSLEFLWSSYSLELCEKNENLKLVDFEYDKVPSLEDMNFNEQKLPSFLSKNPSVLIEEFSYKIARYEIDRDYFYKEASSFLSVYLRFGLISIREVFNKVKSLNSPYSDVFIRQLFWREFYTYILFHFPKSQFENFNGVKIPWNQNEEDFKNWCEGNTGVPLIDASMRYFNSTGLMHNRLRMIVASYLTKNLLINWKKGEQYFASKLLDYECSSNVGSWQWAASTGADAVPYFRIFNPYLQSEKFDKDAVFIKAIIPSLKDIDNKTIHKEKALNENIFIDYPKQIISIEYSRNRAIEIFKRARNEKS